MRQRTHMAKIQFSIRALLFVMFLAALTVGLVRLLVSFPSQMDHSGFIFIAIACVIGPPGMALLGFVIGLESKVPWTGTLVGTLLGTLLLISIVTAFTQALH